MRSVQLATAAFSSKFPQLSTIVRNLHLFNTLHCIASLFSQMLDKLVFYLCAIAAFAFAEVYFMMDISDSCKHASAVQELV
jgi:hypothetical protein